jgi:uncharacterized protein YceK
MLRISILSLCLFTMLATMSGCKVIEEHERASRKYNSNRTYHRKNPKPYVDRATTKMIMDHCRRSRR